MIYITYSNFEEQFDIDWENLIDQFEICVGKEVRKIGSDNYYYINLPEFMGGGKVHEHRAKMEAYIGRRLESICILVM